MGFKGLDELMKKLEELKLAASALDGDITSVTFNPNDPQSIDLAIHKMEAAVDERVGPSTNNEIVEGLVGEMKERYRQAILDRAAAARIAEEGEA